ncbi:MAG: class I SAM-dependent methyltransferase [Bacteroidetes bacterium HGW-Bacteroidetes-15]|nr:MAG: class I SAM-dependent methyltransferase [Bacteroidetes bacterium HGW-Bacteroidetes-15]
MNYSYSKDNQKIELAENEEKDRYSIQLYQLAATGADISGKDILEVGCGRGGGLTYINRQFKPNSSIGIDLNKKAIAFCVKKYSNEKIKFFQGDSQKLNFEDNAFDAVINLESPHRYPNVGLFLSEVYRVLKLRGVLLFADFRSQYDLRKLNRHFKNLIYKCMKNNVITENVLEALKLSTPNREELVRKLLPKFLQNLGRNFAATEGTITYNKFLTGEYEKLFKFL